MRTSHSEYRPIPMSARQVLQSYALLRTMHFDACTYTLNVNLNGFTVSTQVCNHNSVNCHFRCYVWPPKRERPWDIPYGTSIHVSSLSPKILVSTDIHVEA